MKYWAVGSSFGGTDDKTTEFIKNKNWYDGRYENGDAVNIAYLKKITAGDILIMKSSSTKGKGHKTSFTKVKAIGIVQQISDSYKLQVNWFTNAQFPIDFDDISYRRLIEPLRQDRIADFVKIFLDNMNHTEIINLLFQKKQIILQGPPGTGKTRLAKKLANKLIFSIEEIKKSLQLNQKINGADGAPDYYEINKIKDHEFILTSKYTNEKGQRATYKNIRTYIYELIQKKEIIASREYNSYELAVAKYFYENIYKKNLQLIQFHPSYTYEDFVRGITVKSNGNNLEYITKNKVLTKLADKALQNYIDSQKTITEYNRETKTKEYFSQFIEFISDKIEDNNNYFPLTDSVGIIGLDEDAFRYKGKNEGWSVLGNRMLYKDIIQAFLDGNNKRQDLKKNYKLSGLAKQHASYFVRVLSLFYKYLKENDLSFVNLKITKESIKNYVLIIDEINRANLSSVLGELIYALEYRGEPVDSMYELENEGNTIILPPNFYIIGTMNTADRSVGQIDYAIRRRFAFVDVLPEVLDENNLEKGLKFQTEKFHEVKALFEGENNHLSEEFNAKDVQLGHSYFIYKEGEFDLKLQYEIKPILNEYVADGILKESAKEIIDTL